MPAARNTHGRAKPYDRAGSPKRATKDGPVTSDDESAHIHQKGAASAESHHVPTNGNLAGPVSYYLDETKLTETEKLELQGSYADDSAYEDDEYTPEEEAAAKFVEHIPNHLEAFSINLRRVANALDACLVGQGAILEALQRIAVALEPSANATEKQENSFHRAVVEATKAGSEAASD